MSKGLSYKYTGTKGYIINTAASLPKTGDELLKKGWTDISNPHQAEHGSYTYKEPGTGLRIRYDEPVPGAPGFAGKDHYHILNPNATSKKDMYLDKDGNPVQRGSKASHILPKGD
jgi:hypothetical protein